MRTSPQNYWKGWLHQMHDTYHASDAANKKNNNGDKCLLLIFMKKPASKFGLAALVSQPASATSTRSVDDLLFAPADNSTVPTPAATLPIVPSPTRTRFTNTLPTATYVQLHRLAFWDRRDMSAIIEVALQEYFANHPDADKPLPEQERVKRKLPTG